MGHLLSDEPDSQFDLIFLRNNLLTYYLDEFKKPALGKVISHLFKGGFLIIGSIPLRGGSFIEKIRKRKDILLVGVSEKNRDGLLFLYEIRYL